MEQNFENTVETKAKPELRLSFNEPVSDSHEFLLQGLAYALGIAPESLKVTLDKNDICIEGPSEQQLAQIGDALSERIFETDPKIQQRLQEFQIMKIRELEEAVGLFRPKGETSDKV